MTGPAPHIICRRISARVPGMDFAVRVGQWRRQSGFQLGTRPFHDKSEASFPNDGLQYLSLEKRGTCLFLEPKDRRWHSENLNFDFRTVFDTHIKYYQVLIVTCERRAQSRVEWCHREYDSVAGKLHSVLADVHWLWGTRSPSNSSILGGSFEGSSGKLKWVTLSQSILFM